MLDVLDRYDGHDKIKMIFRGVMWWYDRYKKIDVIQRYYRKIVMTVIYYRHDRHMINRGVMWYIFMRDRYDEIDMRDRYDTYIR